MSFFERFLGRSPAEALPVPPPQEPTLALSEEDRAHIAAAVEKERQESEEQAEEVLDTIRKRQRAVGPPTPATVDFFPEDESLRTNQAELAREISKNQAFSERLIILKGLRIEINELPLVNSELARTRVRQILQKRAEMIHQIPRYAEAYLPNIQTTLQEIVENGTLSEVIRLSEAELERSQEKVRELQRMLKAEEVEATQQAWQSSVLRKDIPEV